MCEWKANNYLKTKFNAKREFALGSLWWGNGIVFFTLDGNPRKVISAVDWFKRCHFILLDSIISAESEMSHMDGFQSWEARNFTSTVCSQPKQHMPYDLPSDDFKHPKAYAVWK